MVDCLVSLTVIYFCTGLCYWRTHTDFLSQIIAHRGLGVIFGDRSFAAAAPRTWNELPFSLLDTGLSLTTFNEHLKTYLFSVAF